MERGRKKNARNKNIEPVGQLLFEKEEHTLDRVSRELKIRKTNFYFI